MNDYPVGSVLVPPLIIILLALCAMFVFDADSELQRPHEVETQYSAITEQIEVSMIDTLMKQGVSSQRRRPVFNSLIWWPFAVGYIPKKILNFEETIAEFAQNSLLAANRSHFVCPAELNDIE